MHTYILPVELRIVIHWAFIISILADIAVRDVERCDEPCSFVHSAKKHHYLFLYSHYHWKPYLAPSVNLLLFQLILLLSAAAACVLHKALFDPLMHIIQVRRWWRINEDAIFVVVVLCLRWMTPIMSRCCWAARNKWWLKMDAMILWRKKLEERNSTTNESEGTK